MFVFLPPVSLRTICFDLIGIFMLLVLADVIISNIIAFGGRLSASHPTVRFVRRIVNPVLNPVRRLLPPPHKTGGWDFSPFLVMIVLEYLRRALLGL